MNLLVITNNPDRAGFRQRIGVYLDMLRSNGIDCKIAVLPKGAFAGFRLFRHAGEFDGVFIHKKKLNFIDAPLLRRFARKIIYNFDDAIMYSDKNPFHYSRSHYVPWKRSVSIADIVITGSEYLGELAKKYNGNVHVLELGLDTSDYFCSNTNEGDGKVRLVWIGSKSTLGYLEMIRPALERIGEKFPNAVLRLIGDDFIDLKNMPVEKRKWTKEARAADLASGDIGLAPLPDDPFTRGKCSFKVLEYSASGLAVVASPVGTNREHVTDNVTGFLVNDIGQWVDKISILIEDAQLRRKMGQQGRLLAEESDTKIIGAKLGALIKHGIGQKDFAQG